MCGFFAPFLLWYYCRMKKLIIGNWKMYPVELKEARERFTQIKKTASVLRNVQTVICPPLVYAGDLKKMVAGHRVTLGAQNAWLEQEGAYTGEVSPSQIRSVGLTHVIIGHSERRVLGETDEMINKKILAGIKAGLVVVLCVGERERDKDGEYLRYVASQIKLALKNVQKKELSNMVIAYEPIWAIGKNALRAASSEDALEIAILIKKTLADMYNRDGSHVPILYGGSVNEKNTKDFLTASRIDGLLVGRASLDPFVFGEILRGAEKVK